LLVHAVADILCQAADSTVILCDVEHESLSSSLADNAHAASLSEAASDEPTVNSLSDTSLHTEVTSVSSSQTAIKRRRLGHEQFHSSLR